MENRRVPLATLEEEIVISTDTVVVGTISAIVSVTDICLFFACRLWFLLEFYISER